MHLLLIDDNGELRSDRSEIVRTSYANAYVSGRVSSYLIKNLGFIAIDFFGNSCQVRIRPAIVTDKAVDTLKRWLTLRNVQRIALNYYSDQWNIELSSGYEGFEKRLLELIASYRRTQLDDFMSEIRPTDIAQQNPTFHGILDSWSQFGRNAGKATMSRLLKNVTDGRYAIIKHDPGENSFRIAELGGGYLSFSQRYRTQCKGSELGAQPDPKYGQFVTGAYKRSLYLNEPLVEDVDAIIETQDMGRRRIRYRRMILSRRGTNGENWIVSSSVLDPSIDLRQKAVANLS